MEDVAAAPTLPVNTSVVVAIEERTQIGAARRSAVALGRAQGLDADSIGRLSLVVTEAATNVLRHATRGVIVMRAVSTGVAGGVEVLALDKGMGIGDVSRAVSDGYSTSGTAGQGLGAIRRMSEVFEIYAPRGQGTALLARVFDGTRVARAERAPSLDDRMGAVCVPIRGESVCGDAWSVVVGAQRTCILVIDGLGHGSGAAAAATIGLGNFAPLADDAPEHTLSTLDQALRGSRGAAASMAYIHEGGHSVRFAGVGNVDGRIHLGADTTAHLLPQNGIVGHAMPTPRSLHAPWPAGSRLVMHTDGVSSRWRMDAYPGLATAHPALVAGVIYRDFGRTRDDVTVIVYDSGAPAARA